MTRDQIAASIRTELADAGTFYTDDDINDSIQDAYDEVVAITQPIEKTVELSWIDDLVYYDFYTTVSDYIRPFAVYNNANQVWLNWVSNKHLDEINDEWETADGNTTNAWIVNFRYIAMYPTNPTATGTFDLYYKAKADTLTGTSIPQIPIEFEDILENYVVADLLEQDEQFNKALDYITEYEKNLDDLKKLVESRPLTDRIMRLAPQVPG